MYKVFINDKEVRFIDKNEDVPHHATQLNDEYTSSEIAGSAYALQGPGLFYLRSASPEVRFEKFKNYFPLIRAAGGIVRNHNLAGPVLMIYRFGKWDLPKGKIEKDETIEEAAVREVREECGIKNLELKNKLSETFHLYEYKGKPVIKISHWFLMVSNDIGKLTPQTEEGITEVKWVNEKDISYLLPDAYASIADLLATEILNSRI